MTSPLLPPEVTTGNALVVGVALAGAAAAVAVGLPRSLSTPRTRVLAVGLPVGAMAALLVPGVLASAVIQVAWAMLALWALPGQGGARRLVAVGLVLPLASVLVAALPFEWAPEHLALLGCLAGAAVFPLHSWAPALFQRVPPPVAALVLMGGMGATAWVRLLGPEANEHARLALSALGVGTAVYASLLACVQADARRMVGWYCVSLSSQVLTGLALGNASAGTGGILMWVSALLCGTGLALAVTSAESRLGDSSLERFHGLAVRAPALSGAFLLCGLGGVGLPGMLGFVAEDLLYAGAVARLGPIGLLLLLAGAFNAVAVLRAYGRLFLGSTPVSQVGDLLARERAALGLLVVALFLGGVLPRPLAPAATPVVHGSTSEVHP